MQETPVKKRKRGTENVRDMVLSLIAVFAVILPFYFLAGLADQEEGGIRTVDTSRELGALQDAVPGVPVPQGLPEEFRSTSSSLEGPRLRIGYVTPGEQYAEYAAAGPDAPESFLREQTGEGRRTTEIQVGARTFEVWTNEGGATSLVLQDPDWTVVVGGLRETADDNELTTLAESLAP